MTHRDAADVRELRALLKSAQNDVKRYAAQVVRLQQELDRERLAHKDDDAAPNDEVSIVGDELQDAEIERTTRDAQSVQQSLAALLRDATSDCDLCHCRPSHTVERDAADGRSVQQIKNLSHLIEAQKRQIVALARENAKLRDTLEKRPTHRDLARSQWQIESLQDQVARLKENERATLPEIEAGVPVFDMAPQETLSDRISVDKLLSWLHVETKRMNQPEGAQAKRNRRRFLKEAVECYLVLDAAALDGASGSTASTVTENEKMKKREQLSRRVGIVCSEIVASCCHSVGVYEVAKLPRYVEATYQYAQLVPLLQDFVLRIDDLMRAAGVRPAAAREARRDTSSGSFLETLSSRVQDLVFEVRARREQMAPPGDRALAVVLRCMNLLQADRIDQLSPTIERLLDTTRKERGFLQDVRNVLGLDVAASRTTVLELITKLMEQIGMTTSAHQPARARVSSHDGLSSSQAAARSG